MPANVYELDGHRILECAPDMALNSERDASDLIGQALGAGVGTVVVPVACLNDDFFALRTRIAGEIVQKFTNYGLRLVVVGDIAKRLEASTALRDFVREANERTQLWFLPDRAAFEARLSRQ